MTIKILNLYAGIGGNRKLWKDVEVTAVENNQELVKIYREIFQEDKVIVADAREYLLEHFKEFDFIWASPPCTTHSRARYWASGGGNPRFKTYKPVYADLSLYEIILFLKYFFKGKWVVENVVSYYKPLIEPVKIGKHWFWANFQISKIKYKAKHFGKNSELARDKGINLDLLKNLSTRKDQVLRNTMAPGLGNYILKEGLNTTTKSS